MIEQRPQIYTSHWRSPLLQDLGAVIVSISRGQPRWPLPFKYRKLRALAPNDRTWALEDQERFEESYREQLGELGADRILADLEGMDDGRPVVLLCWERPTEECCHRWTLARYLREETGLVVPELEAGMLTKRPDAPQPALFD